MYVVINIDPGTTLNELMAFMTQKTITFSVTDQLSRLCGGGADRGANIERHEVSTQTDNSLSSSPDENDNGDNEDVEEGVEDVEYEQKCHVTPPPVPPAPSATLPIEDVTSSASAVVAAKRLKLCNNNNSNVVEEYATTSPSCSSSVTPSSAAELLVGHESTTSSGASSTSSGGSLLQGLIKREMLEETSSSSPTTTTTTTTPPSTMMTLTTTTSLEDEMSASEFMQAQLMQALFSKSTLPSLVLDEPDVDVESENPTTTTTTTTSSGGGGVASPVSAIRYKPAYASTKRGVCHVCNREVSLITTHRRRHAITHLGFKTLKCSLCHKFFSRQDLATGHFKKDHPDADFTPFMDTMTLEDERQLDIMLGLCFPEENLVRKRTRDAESKRKNGIDD